MMFSNNISNGEHVKYINQLSVAQINKNFTRWFDLVAAGASVDELIPEIWNLCNRVVFQTLKFSDDINFFRARASVNSEYCTNVQQLWYPPVEAVQKLGRANNVNSPVLYLAQDGRTALFEGQHTDGQHVTVAEIRLKTGMHLNLQHVGVVETLTDNFSSVENNQIKRLRKLGFTNIGINNLQLIHRLLAEEFMRDVELGYEHGYVVSVAIAQFFFTYTAADGLLFPSKRSRNDFNIAIKPSSADQKLYVKRAYGVEVVDTAAIGTIGFRYHDASTAIDDDGKIEWTSGHELPPLDWYSANNSALSGPFKWSPRDNE